MFYSDSKSTDSLVVLFLPLEKLLSFPAFDSLNEALTRKMLINALIT